MDMALNKDELDVRAPRPGTRPEVLVSRRGRA